MAKAKYLEKASGVFFFSGFMLSKLQYLPFPLLAAIFRLASLGVYLLGYGLWSLASLIQPGQKKREDKWYGFAKLKDQYFYSSLIGFIATVVSVVAISVPFIFPLAAWLYVIGNVVWAIGEYHKLRNPPINDTNFSYDRQRSYFKYAVTTTLISSVAALSATLILALPLISIPITVFSLCICIGLGAFAFENWLDANFGEHEPTPRSESYSKMDFEMQSRCSPSPENDHTSAPYHGKSPIADPKPEKTKSKIEIHSKPKSEDNADLIGLTPCSTL